MKLYTAAAVLLVSLFATSMALPARMAYYQQPSFYYQSRSSPQQLMYLQYVQQPSSSKTHARLTNTAAAFVAGDSVATGTYVKDDVSEEQQIVEESILDNTGANGAQSVAEAYPEPEPEYVQGDDDVADAAQIAEAEVPAAPETPEDNQVLEDELVPVAEELPSEAEEPAVAAEEVPEPAIAFAAEASVPEILEPSAVDIPEEAESDDDEEPQENVNNARRSPAPKPSPAPLPAGSFFSVDFGGATGGATAIANSFSTGVSGKAKSQAIAYGKPEPARYRAVRRH